MRCLVGALLLISLPASAQTDLVRRYELHDVRISHQLERRESGIVLFAGGAGSVLAGVIAMGAGYDDPFTLMFGAGMAAWGAVNTALSIGMLDLGDGGLNRIREESFANDPDQERERAIRSQVDTGIFYAVNLWLDFAYLASAVILYAVADRIAEREHLRGYASAQIVQGLFLFAFDTVGALTSDRRAQRLRSLE